MNKKNGQVLVTGGAGFIGSHLISALLEEGFRVRVIDDLSGGRLSFVKPFTSSKSFSFVKGSLLNEPLLTKSLIGCQRVYHLAANSDLRTSLKSPLIDFEKGIQATFQLLEGMRQARASELVYLSGSGVYGDRAGRPYKEHEGPYIPVSMYGAAKLSSEALISAYSNLYGIKSTILRPANVVGGNATHGVIFDLIHKLKSNSKELSVLGDGHQTKSYLHVSDLVAAIVFLGKRKVVQPRVEIFNVGHTSTVSVRWIVKEIMKAMKLKGVQLRWGQSAIGWKGDVPKYSMDLSLIRKTGWRARMTSEEAVRFAIHEILCEMELSA